MGNKESLKGGNEDHQMENKDLSRLKGGNEDHQIRNKDLSRVGMRTTK